MKLYIERNERNVLGFKDVFQSGKTYENLLRGFIQKMLAGGMQKAIEWMVKKYGKKNGDMDLWWKHWSNSDGDYCAYALVVTDEQYWCRDGEVNHRWTIYEECTADSDDSGFIGDFDVYSQTLIDVHTKNGRKCTTLKTIWDDCQIYLAKYINAVDSMRIR